MTRSRSVSLIVAALAVAIVVAGCGGDDDSGNLESVDAAAIDTKLAQVEERAVAGRCTGDNSALSSLDSLSEFVASDSFSYVAEQTRTDLEELLQRLGEQIQSQCDQVSEIATTTTTETTDTETTTTDDEETTDRTTTTTRETTDTETRETTSPQSPGNGGGGNSGGGNSGGNAGGSGGGNQGGPPAPPGNPDGSGGIGPGVIGPILRSSQGNRGSVHPGEDDSPQADQGTSR